MKCGGKDCEDVISENEIDRKIYEEKNLGNEKDSSIDTEKIFYFDLYFLNT